MISPAPSLLRPEEAVPARELRTDTDREDSGPATERDSRPETDRREACDREVTRLDAEERSEGAAPEAAALPGPRGPGTPPAPGALPALPEPPAPPPVPAALPVRPPAMLAADTTGASPQVSQYRRPPPMSS
ncbi:hypothetical protein [Streptomyces sp. ACA25]|uniref:hypothetical protein n=1 Tax=Streptomyces sp. ACA25 TaxID=3022596 RepID=UPI003FA7459D